MISRKKILGMALITVVFSTVGLNGFFAKTVQDRNDDAAKKVERKFKQYNRVHQDLLK